MYILGINFSSHDTSACLVRDGELVAFIEEERLTRIKHTSAFPERAIAKILADAHITLKDIDYIALPTTHAMPIGTVLSFHMSFGIRNFIPLLMKHVRYRFKFYRALRRFQSRVDKKKTKIVFVEHHMSHMANAFLVSPFQKAAIFTVDNNGDGLSSRLGVGEGNTITTLRTFPISESIGNVYYLTTQFLGFSEEGGEGKVMGLSSYGDPETFIHVFRDMVRLRDDGSYTLNKSYFSAIPKGLLNCDVQLSELFIHQVGPARKHSEPLTQVHYDIAAALQKITEETIVHVLKHLHARTQLDTLVLAGGVTLNSVMNGKLHRLTPFKEIFIQPLSYDGGNAIGASFYVWNVLLGNTKRFQFTSCYLGPAFSTEQIRAELQEMKLPFEEVDDPSSCAADLIANGKIIGWFQGRMEAGARALGNRSILANPRMAEMKDIVNAYVKHREPFRPFAPAILVERVGAYFDDTLPVPFMERVFDVRKERRADIPAVTHVDGTGRLQTVSQEQNPRFYKLIQAFEQRTGVPVVLNTSFNIRGEPIVCTPADAIRCFYSTGMDALILDRFLLKK
ncbi:MAG: carbamoyltransferase C-terminal domain-containing protein [Patescibacteria group bacterium]